MKNTSLGFLPAKPSAADQAVLSASLEQYRGAGSNGIDKFTCTAWHCLPTHKLAVHQSAQSPIERFASVLTMVKTHKVEQLRMRDEFRAQDLAQERKIARLVELNGAFRIPHSSSSHVLQLKPRTPGPGHERPKLESAKIGSQPTSCRHQQHRFLLVTAFAE